MSDESLLIVPEPEVGSIALPCIRNRSPVAVRKIKHTSVCKVPQKLLECVNEGQRCCLALKLSPPV